MHGELKVTAHSFVLLQLSSEICVPTLEALWQLWPIEYACMRSQLFQPCPTFCNSMDCSLPGSSVHGILQARILEWVAIHFSRRIFPIQGSNSCFLQCRRIFLPTEPPGKPLRIQLIIYISIVEVMLCQSKHRLWGRNWQLALPVSGSPELPCWWWKGSWLVLWSTVSVFPSSLLRQEIKSSLLRQEIKK